MKRVKKYFFNLFIMGLTSLVFTTPGQARIKMVALPERGHTTIRLDNPQATLIEEERILTLQNGLNSVDFSWKGVNIDEDSIRLTILSHNKMVALLSVSYPPNEAALVWEIHSKGAFEVSVRISYLLSYIDRLITYKGIANKEESHLKLKNFLILRNFSGENFKNASILLNDGQIFKKSIGHAETSQLLFFKKENIPIEKIWTFDARKLPWDPEKLNTNIGIPVSYRLKNEMNSGLGSAALFGGKVRVFQEDGAGGTIFLGEDSIGLVPIGEDMAIYIGDSRDIVVTQHKIRNKRINIRRNNKHRIVLYDTDELIKTTIENFKDRPAMLTMVQYIPGQWDMTRCNMQYKRKDAFTIEFKIVLQGRDKKDLIMNYHRRNVR